MNLKLAAAALEFCHTAAADANGKAIKVITPAHGGRRAIVTLSRFARTETHLPALSVHCEQFASDDNDNVPCPGCQHGELCYHAIAAIQHAGKPGSVFFYGNIANAKQHAERSPGAVLFSVQVDRKPITVAVAFPPRNNRKPAPITQPAAVVKPSTHKGNTPFPEVKPAPITQPAAVVKPGGTCPKCNGVTVRRVLADGATAFLSCMGATGQEGCGYRSPSFPADGSNPPEVKPAAVALANQHAEAEAVTLGIVPAAAAVKPPARRFARKASK